MMYIEDLLAANDREVATPEGAANIGEDAPLPNPSAPPVNESEKGDEEGKGWTRKVAQRIKEERQKAQNELITELFGDETACNAYRVGREQEKRADLDREESSLYAELALASDPELGGYYLALEDEVQSLAEQYGADMESAFLLVLKQHLPRLLREERLKGEQELLARLSATASGPGSLADASASAPGLSALSDAEFAAMVQRVKLKVES